MLLAHAVKTVNPFLLNAIAFDMIITSTSEAHGGVVMSHWVDPDHVL